MVWANTNGQPEMFGGITSAEDGSALTIGPTAGPRVGDSDDFLNILVDSGASGHFFDDAIIPTLRDRLEKHKVLNVRRETSTAAGGGLSGIALGLLRGHVVDDKGVRR